MGEAIEGLNHLATGLVTYTVGLWTVSWHSTFVVICDWIWEKGSLRALIHFPGRAII